MQAILRGSVCVSSDACKGIQDLGFPARLPGRVTNGQVTFKRRTADRILTFWIRPCDRKSYITSHPVSSRRPSSMTDLHIERVLQWLSCASTASQVFWPILRSRRLGLRPAIVLIRPPSFSGPKRTSVAKGRIISPLIGIPHTWSPKTLLPLPPRRSIVPV